MISRWMRCALSALTLGIVALGVAPAAAAERSLDKMVVIKAPLDDAWAAWTTRDGIVSFMAPAAEVDATPGGAFHIYFDPLAPAGMRGADDMRYMALQPKRMLSFDWNAPPQLPEVRSQRTLVVLRFDPVDDGQTLVTLHHTGWGTGGEWDQAYGYFDKAWDKVLENLKLRFERGPQDWSTWMAQLRQVHGMVAAPADVGASAPTGVASGADAPDEVQAPAASASAVTDVAPATPPASSPSAPR